MIKLKLKIFLPSIIFGLVVANFASAAFVTCGGNGQTACSIPDLIFTIERIINFLLSWAWLISLFFIMWAGYDMIFTGGNSEQLQAAKSKLSHAIIGFVLIMVSYLLVNWIVGLFSGDGSHGAGVFDIYRNLLPKP